MYNNRQPECDMFEPDKKGFCKYSNWNMPADKAEKIDGGGYVQMCTCNKFKPLMCPYIFKRI